MNGNLIQSAENAYSYPLLIKQLLHTPLACSPNREIVYAKRSRYNYLTLRERIGRLGNALRALGINYGDTVAVMDWDSPRYLECFFAIPMLGAVLHHVNVRLSPEQILYTINHAEDDAILVHSDFLPLLEGLRDRFHSDKKIILLSDDERRVTETVLELAGEYESLLADNEADCEFLDFDENTRATTFYTTGTTGDPKGVYYSHRQLVLHTLAVMGQVGAAATQGRFHREDVYMPITPMFHVHGWGIPYIATLMGVKQVYPGRYEPQLLLDLIRDEGVTFSHCVPTILHLLLSCPAVEEMDLSNWKCVIGGSALPKGLASKALSLGIDIYAGYGMSETGPVLTLAQIDGEVLARSPDSQLALRCKTGRPGPLVDLRVVDEQMRDVPHDGKATGEVVVRAPWLTQGYLRNPQGSESLWRGGYLHTGDIGHIDSDGYLKITDRSKDVIKSGGEWISSLEIESIISEHPAVGEVATVAMPDDKWGERPLALVVLKPEFDSEVTEDAIRDHVRNQSATGAVSKWAVPERVMFVEVIEKTSVGKIDKKALRQKYVGQCSR